MTECLDAMFRMIRERLLRGQGTHIRGFGTFTFTHRPRVGQKGRAHSLGGRIVQDDIDRDDVVLKPIFKLDEALMKRSAAKEKLETPRIPRFSGSIYDAGPSAAFLNPITIAAKCGSSATFVRACLNDFFLAISDLILVRK